MEGGRGMMKRAGLERGGNLPPKQLLIYFFPKFFFKNSRSICGYTGNFDSSFFTRSLACFFTVSSITYFALLGLPAFSPELLISGFADESTVLMIDAISFISFAPMPSVVT